MTDNNGMAVQNALQGAGIQFAMPQRLEPVTNKTHQVQKVIYDQAKLQALKDALAIKRTTMGDWETFANTLAQTPETRSFTGGFGEEIINPWAVGLSSLARGFGGAYSARKASEREAEEKEREDAIKAAQMDLEASKQQIADTIEDTQMKVNDPYAKQNQELAKVAENLRALEALREENRKLAGDFDNTFTVKDENGNVDIDKTLEAYRGASGTLHTWQNPNSWWGWGTSKKEADARSKSATLRESQLNNIYQSLKGAGAITDTELRTMAQTAKDAYNPYLLDLSISNSIRNIKDRYPMLNVNTNTGNAF